MISGLTDFLSIKRKTAILKIIVLNSILKLVEKENKTRILAAFFLIVFLAEFGSHAVICADHSSSGEQAIYSHESGHDDPCKTLVLCSDSNRKDKQMPNLGHDATQHNALFDGRSSVFPQIGVQKGPKIPFTTAHSLFRPPSPPFHPPELS